MMLAVSVHIWKGISLATAVSGKNNGGCGFAIVAVIVIALAVAVLQAIWWLLFVIAAVLVVIAFSVRNRNADETGDSQEEDDPFYTQKCVNCGGQIKVSAYSNIATCQYCGSSFPAENKPIEKPTDEEHKRFFYSPFQALVTFAIVFAILGCIGLGLSLSSGDTSSSASQGSSTEAVETDNG